ncbi:hypothetical protein [Enterobacter cloacae]|uniref:hypothetical protein n=1 Tax=Enterobacter cloacae TaxID=550 RepID=UPI00128F75F3|nr:hypothetical protein [Enterobacter cloacae]
MTGSSSMDNIIIAGARIYFPPDNRLPNASGDMLTFAVVRDPDTFQDYLLFVHKDGQWELASPRLFKEAAYAISTATKIASSRFPSVAC